MKYAPHPFSYRIKIESEKNNENYSSKFIKAHGDVSNTKMKV